MTCRAAPATGVVSNANSLVFETEEMDEAREMQSRVIIGVLKQAENRRAGSRFTKRLGVIEMALNWWRRRFGGLEVLGARWAKEIERNSRYSRWSRTMRSIS